MDEQEFRRLIDLFPIVRSRDYNAAESEPSRPSTSQSQLGQLEDNVLKEWQDAWNEGGNKETQDQGIDLQDPFWEKLRLAAERKVGAEEAEKFCQAFQHIHKKLVYEDLSLDAARSIINSSTSYGR